MELLRFEPPLDLRLEDFREEVERDFVEDPFFDPPLEERLFVEELFVERDFVERDFVDVDLRDFVLDDLREVEDFFDPVDFFEDDFFDADFLAGTLPPSARASERPIAIACLRLLTVLPEPPLFNVPRFRSCIAFSTLSCAFCPYFAIRILSFQCP
jgi:hypothetical protein